MQLRHRMSDLSQTEKTTKLKFNLIRNYLTLKIMLYFITMPLMNQSLKPTVKQALNILDTNLPTIVRKPFDVYLKNAFCSTRFSV